MTRDPLTLDLDNDGLETVGINTSNPILFDHTGEGVKTATGWIKSDDGLLVLDRNGNGTIDNGSELFGDSTPLYAGGRASDGFGALSQEDTNADGRVDNLDAHFNQFHLWRDLNQDGISQGDELFTLGQEDIAALQVAKTENTVILSNGNQIADLGGYLRTDGSGGTLGVAEQLADIDLINDPFYSQFTDHIALSDATRNLPDMPGSGMVRSLREAASLATPEGETLATRLAEYSEAATRAEELALIDGLVQAWAATSSMPGRGDQQLYRQGEWTLVWHPELQRYLWSLSSGSALESNVNRDTLATLAIVEAFNGSQLPGNAFFSGQLALLEQSRAAVNASVYDGLILQTRLKPYLDAITLDIDENGISLNYAEMIALLDAKKAGDVPNAVFDLVDLFKYASSQLPAWDGAGELEAWAAAAGSGSAVKSALAAMGFVTPSGSWSGTSGDDSVFGSEGADQLSGNAGNDMLMGGGGNDFLTGNSGSDNLVGGGGDDTLRAAVGPNLHGVDYSGQENDPNTLEGGAGSDRLYGGGGSDSYRYKFGDGADTIYETSYRPDAYTASDTASDRIVLGAGILPDDVTVMRSGNDLILRFAHAGDQITVSGWYNVSASRIEQLAFADGTLWDRATLHAAGLVVQGTAGADTLSGLSSEADALYGNAGNDTLVGYFGNDTLVGGSGDDVLWGGEGLSFSGTNYSYRETDANILEGGAGSDTLYGGAGSDSYRYSPGDGADRIYETGYVSPDGSTRTDTASDAIVLGTGILPADVTVMRSGIDLILRFANAGDQITLSGWYNASGSRIEQLQFADGTLWDRTTLHAAGLVVQGTAGADTLSGLNSEADALYGNAGNDTLIGYAGSDILVGGSGDDELRAAVGPNIHGVDYSSQETDANTLEGGSGDDRLYGGAGSDTYRYELGDGADTIHETAYVSADGLARSDTATDRIVLGPGILPADVTVMHAGGDLILKFANAGDQITLSGWYAASGSRIEQLLYADGTLWDRATLQAAGLVIQGTSGADTLYGLANETDVFDGLGGKDQLYGYSGDDVYLFGIGSGQDTINEDDATSGNVDTVRFKAGVLPDAVAFGKAATTLTLSIDGTTDKIAVANWFAGAQYRIERIEFLDGPDDTLGTVWTRTDIDEAVAAAIIAANAAPLLASPLADRTAIEGIAFAFSLDPDVFADADPDDQLSYSAELANGDALPAWLKFTAATQRFGGTPASDAAGQWQLCVTATDTLGASVSGTFTLDVTNHVQGSENNDMLGGTDGPDVIDGLAGEDTLCGSGGNDTLRGGPGHDVYVIDDVDYVMVEYAAEGIDTVQSAVSYSLGANLENLELLGTEALEASGNELDNLLSGNEADNRLNGSDGNDTLDGGSGADTLSGGPGNDCYVVDESGDDIIENPGEGDDTVQSSLSYALGANLENLTLTGTEPLDGTGNALDNLLSGNAAGNRLNGGEGNDTLDGAAGSDTLSGGAGDDTYRVDHPADLAIEAANQGDDVLIASVSTRLPENIENLVLAGKKPLTAIGNALDNRLSGNAAANTLDGGAGADTLSGGLGNDVYFIDDPGDVVAENPGEGTDTVHSSVSFTLGAEQENLTLSGNSSIDGAGNELKNFLKGNAAANRLRGGPGDDSLDGGAGADSLSGGTGNDVYWVDDAGDSVVEAANQGIDAVIAALSYQLPDNIENLTLAGNLAIDGAGNRLNNLLTGNAAANLLRGGPGKDTLKGGAGADTLIGGSGDDAYIVDDAGDSVVEQAGEGSDTVQSTVAYSLGPWLENLILIGTDAVNGSGNELNNHLSGNTAANLLSGGNGNDTLNGGAGTDTLVGGPGNDVYVVDNNGDVVLENAGEGNDTVQSKLNCTLGDNLENLVLTGSALHGTGNALDNLLSGNAAANRLDGAPGNDTLNGGAGADSLVGGPGDDSYIVDHPGDVVVELISEGTDVVNSSVAYTLPANVEHLTLTGSANTDGSGNALDNRLTGNGGANLLSGGDGDDSLDGKAGSDTLIGGLGNDIYYLDNAGDLIIETAAQGEDTAFSTVSRILDANVENLILLGTAGLSAGGNAGSNLLHGNAGGNAIDGGAGPDFLEGMAGNDTLTDSAGNNYFGGGAGNDQLIAGSGNDLLIGGAGNDTINAGDGWNVIAFNRGDGNDVINLGSNASDTISLGGGITYADLSFRKKGNDLMLDTGHGEGMTFRNWYADAAGKHVLTLQIVAEAMPGFASDSATPLLAKKIQEFDFRGLAGSYDAARTATATLTSWALSNGLAQSQLSSSDDMAYGGNLAYQYGRRGTLGDIDLASAGQILDDAQFGLVAQTLQPLSGLPEGIMQLG